RAQKLTVDDASATLTFFTAVRRDMNFQADALGGQLRAVLELAQNATPRGEEAFAKREAANPLWLRFAGRLATLRANLTMDSVVFRHALRLMACVAAGDAFGGMLHSYRAYLVPLTGVLGVKP